MSPSERQFLRHSQQKLEVRRGKRLPNTVEPEPTDAAVKSTITKLKAFKRRFLCHQKVQIEMEHKYW